MAASECMGKRKRPDNRLRITLLAAVAWAFFTAGALLHTTGSSSGKAAPPAFVSAPAAPCGRLRLRTACGAGASAPPVGEEDLIGISTIEDFQAKLSGDVVVAMFSSPFCGPCMLVEPMIGQMAKEFKDSIQILKVNLIPGQTGKALKPLFSEHSVKELPTFIVFKGGEVQGRVTGTRHKELRTLIEGLI